MTTHCCPNCGHDLSALKCGCGASLPPYKGNGRRPTYCLECAEKADRATRAESARNRRKRLRITSTTTCGLCERPFETSDSRRKYCDACSPHIAMQSGAATVALHLQNVRGAVPTLPAHEFTCADCQAPFTVFGHRIRASQADPKYCKSCAQKRRTDGFHTAMRPAGGYEYERLETRAGIDYAKRRERQA